jgi:hypothetical protein
MQQVPELRIQELVTAHGSQWFPELGGAPGATWTLLSHRPSCSMYVVRLSSNGATRRALAKVRRPVPVSTAGSSRAPRPRLRTTAASHAELAELEYEGLSQIHADLAPRYPEFGAVRPLTLLASHSTIVMEYVEQPTLRDGFVAASRLVPARRSTRRVPPEAAWRNAGAWLRAFHDLPERHDRPARQPTAGAVVERFHAYGDFLASRLNDPRLNQIAAAGATVASDVLDEHLDLCVGHGDYAGRNIFVDAGGRVTVFDPMPRWRVPRFEDLCRFVVGLRLSGPQLHSQGYAYSSGELARMERLFLAGYYGDDHIPYRQLKCYELLILLDKWSSLVDTGGHGAGWRARLQRAAMIPANAYAQRQARQLLDTIRSP